MLCGIQVVEIYVIELLVIEFMFVIVDLCLVMFEEVVCLLLLLVWVKWFDKVKGFGFVNIFEQKVDVFLYVEVLCYFGFLDLVVGEVIVLWVVDGCCGMMVVQVLLWECVVVEV